MTGKTISHYEIIEKLGEGGMGVVYKAEDTKLKREVAIKFLPHHTAVDVEERQRFNREAQAAAVLNHNNIATIYEIDEVDGQDFIAMELIEGQNLKEKIAQGPMDLDQVVRIATEAADGLHEAHEHKIIHRDIKPANIMLTSKGQCKIMDFGLAKMAGRTQLTKEGTSMGTISYMSPEQAQGVKVDHRTDIWALGAVIYEMITGKQPFVGDYEQAVIYSIMNEDPDPITGLRTGVPIEVERITDKAMAKSPEERYQRMEDLAVDLRRVKKEIEAPEKSFSRTGGVSTKVKSEKRPFLAVGIIALVFLLVAGGFYLWQEFSRERTESGTETTELSRIRNLPKIAVLYLENLGGNPEEDFFAAGLTEDIITELSNIKKLHVLSRHDVQPYRDKNMGIKEIGEDLQVNYIIEGSVRRSMSKLRVTVQLIKVENGFQTWAQKFDRELRDVFKVQDEIAIAAANALEIKLSAQERQIVNKIPTTNMTAYDLYLKGRQFLDERSRQDNLQAEKMFRQALNLDDKYVLAYIGLADAFLQRPNWGWDRDPKLKEEAKKFIDKAAAIDSSLVELHTSLSMYYFQVRDLPSSIAAINRVLALRPNDYLAHYNLGYYLRVTRRWQEAEREFKISLQLRPNDPEPYRWLARLARQRGSPDHAIRYIEKSVELAPNVAHILNQAAGQHWHSGNFQKAAFYWQKAIELKPGNFVANLGRNELFQRRLPEAIAHLPKDSFWIAHAYRLHGEQTKSEEAFRATLLRIEKSQRHSHLSPYASHSALADRYLLLLLKCLLGQVDDPKPELAELSTMPVPNESEDPAARLFTSTLPTARIYAAVGDTERSIDAIQQVLQFNVYSPKWIAAEPSFEGFNSNPRFIELVNAPWPAITKKD